MEFCCDFSPSICSIHLCLEHCTIGRFRRNFQPPKHEPPHCPFGTAAWADSKNRYDKRVKIQPTNQLKPEWNSLDTSRAHRASQPSPSRCSSALQIRRNPLSLGLSTTPFSTPRPCTWCRHVELQEFGHKLFLLCLLAFATKFLPRTVGSY